MEVIQVPTQQLIPYEQNPRKNESAVGPVASSIQTYGFRQPIVVDENYVIIVGHTRWKAAVQLGLESVPVHVARDLTLEQARAYRVADNQLGGLATWNEELLAVELQHLQSLDVDLGLLGFSQQELNQLLGQQVVAGPIDPDVIPEPPDDPISQPGDLWTLGRHRLLCGDAGSAGDMDRLVDGESIHLVNSDPPYNVQLRPRSDIAKHGKGKQRPKDRPLLNDFVSVEQYEKLLHSWFGNIARVLRPGGSFYLWGGYSNLANYPAALATNELYFSQALVWHKQHPVVSRKDYMGDFELCYYGWRAGAAHSFYGPNNATDVWAIKKVSPASMIHLTEKPTALAVQALQYSSLPGEHVLDAFGGSGSTLIAAEQTGRRAFVLELDPLYCDVIVRRWQQFTGQTAIRESSQAGTVPLPLVGTAT